MTTTDPTTVAYSHSPEASVVLTAAGSLDGRLPFSTGLPEQIARPLAELLQNIGDAMHDDWAGEVEHPHHIPSKRWLVHPDSDRDRPDREHWTDALRLARALLGRPDPNAAEAVDRLRADQQRTAPGQAEPLTADVDLAAWASQVADAHRYYEAPHPGDDRDRGLVEWVVMALGNPEQEGAREVLAVLAARHGLELAPTGTAAGILAVEGLLAVTDGDPLGDVGIAIPLGQIRRVLGEARAEAVAR